MPSRSVRSRMFGPIERAGRRAMIRELTRLRPRGMVDGEILLELDEEAGPERRLWVASTLAVYVLEATGRKSSGGYWFRADYGTITDFDERPSESGGVVRILIAEGENGPLKVSGDFKRPRTALSESIRQRLG